MADIAVLGIGNILLRDDGIGVHIVNALEKDGVLPEVNLIDGGTSILDLLDVFVKHKKVIVVDSLKGGHEPGTIYKLPHTELGDYVRANQSLHDVQVLDIIGQVELMGYKPEVVIVGIEPLEIYFEMALTELIEAQIPKIIETVIEEVRGGQSA